MITRSLVTRAVAGIVPLVLTVSACASSGSGSPRQTVQPSSSAQRPATASARLGALRITGGYIPEPASPDVAAAYLTVANTGSTPDTLVKVTTDVATHVMAMTETEQSGAGSMTMLPKVIVPAHGTFRFAPGHAHLMLMHPVRPLRSGDRVSVVLTFSTAGTTTLTLPVVPLTAVVPGAPMSGMPMSGMSGSGTA